MVVTRRQLFEGILDALGEKIVLRCTTVGSTQNTFADANNCQFPDNELRGREVWYAESNNAASADNKWTRVFVDSNSRANTRITVKPNFAAEPQVGDVVILANARGYSAMIPEIHSKIDDLVRESADEMAAETTSAAVTFNGLTGTVAIPTSWSGGFLLGAQYQTTGPGARWKTIPPEDLDFFEDLWNADGPRLAIKNRSASLANRRQVRLIGAIPPSVPENDDSSINLDYAWARFRAAADLRRDLAIRWGDVASALTVSQLLQAQADQFKPRVGRRFSPVGRRWRIP